MISAPRRKIRIKAITHHSHEIRFSLKNGELRNHGLNLRELVFTAVRHKYRRRADRAVKHLDKSLLRAYVEVGQRIEPRLFNVSHIMRLKRIPFLVRNLNRYVRLLMRSVRVKESPAYIDDLFASPLKHKALFFGHDGDSHRLKVLLVREGEKFIDIGRIDDDSHSLLRFGDRKLGAVKSRVFLGNLIERDSESVRKLSYSDRHSAGSEIVAFLYYAAYLGTSEKSLYFTLSGCVSLLHLRSAGVDGFFGVSL